MLELYRNILNSKRIPYTNNFHTSVSLAKNLLKNNTYLVSTLRKNRKLNPKKIGFNCFFMYNSYIMNNFSSYYDFYF